MSDASHRRRRSSGEGTDFVRLGITIKKDTLERVKRIAEKEDRNVAHMIDILLQRQMLDK